MASWYIVRSDDKRYSRFDCISNILSLMPYKKVKREEINLPKRSNKHQYDDLTSIKDRRFVATRY
jgi:polyphosphate kinase